MRIISIPMRKKPRNFRDIRSAMASRLNPPAKNPVDRSFVQTEPDQAIIQVHRRVKGEPIVRAASTRITIVEHGVKILQLVRVPLRRGHFVNHKQNPVGYFDKAKKGGITL